MKKEIKGNMIFAPLPVLMIGTFDENGKANLMNAAWGGQVDSNVFVVSLSSHKTTDNLFLHHEFTVAFANKDTEVESDYFGIESGRKADKIEKTHFAFTKSEKVNAPVFERYPLTLECVLDHVDEEEGFYYGKVVGMVADERVLDENGKVDFDKCQFITFDSAKNCYRIVGEKVGNAFKDGMQFK